GGNLRDNEAVPVAERELGADHRRRQVDGNDGVARLTGREYEMLVGGARLLRLDLVGFAFAMRSDVETGEDVGGRGMDALLELIESQDGGSQRIPELVERFVVASARSFVQRRFEAGELLDQLLLRLRPLRLEPRVLL